jgi:hypothetical protein
MKNSLVWRVAEQGHQASSTARRSQPWQPETPPPRGIAIWYIWTTNSAVFGCGVAGLRGQSFSIRCDLTKPIDRVAFHQSSYKGSDIGNESEAFQAVSEYI